MEQTGRRPFHQMEWRCLTHELGRPHRCKWPRQRTRSRIFGTPPTMARPHGHSASSNQSSAVTGDACQPTYLCLQRGRIPAGPLGAGTHRSGCQSLKEGLGHYCTAHRSIPSRFRSVREGMHILAWSCRTTWKRSRHSGLAALQETVR
jgi:hypothetical protein